MIGISTLVAAIVAFAVTAISGKFFIPYLRKLKYGQTILDIGPKWHKSKQGTPTMGGVMFILGAILGIISGVVVCAVFWSDLYSGETQLSHIRLWSGVLLCIFSGLIGFFDDYLKVVKKQNQGLKAGQKMLLQVLTALAYAITLYLVGDTNLWIPFVGTFDLGIFYIPLVVFLVSGFNNAVNLTDGIDGLAGSTTFIFAIFFMTMSGIICGSAGMSIFSSAIAGGCLGFLIWNFFPAKVFMGDTGSLFLGGAVCAMAFGIGKPILLLLAGIVYVMETASVILQVGYFKLTKGKRLFKMTPIHHHFEMSGFNEIKICMLFCFITLLGCAGSYLLAYFG